MHINNYKNKFDINALRKLNNEYSMLYSEIGRWIGANGRDLKRLLKSNQESIVSWNKELTPGELQILENMFKNKEVFYHNEQEDLIVKIYKNSQNSIAIFLKNKNDVKCLFNSPQTKEMLNQNDYYKFSLYEIKLINKLIKIANTNTTPPEVDINYTNLYHEVRLSAERQGLKKSQYIEKLGFKAINCEDRNRIDVVKLKTIERYKERIIKDYLVEGNKVFINKGDIFYKKLYRYGYYQRPSLTVAQLLEKWDFQLINKSQLPPSYQGHCWQKEIGDIIDEVDYQEEVENIVLPEDFKSKDEPKKKPEKKAGAKTNQWPRNPETAKKSIVLADYCCEADASHSHFISKVTNKNYVEAHHLIPMSAQDGISVSIDVEANIIALCIACHKKLHHAVFAEKKPILEQLFNQRKQRLLDCEIEVTLEELYNYYR